MTATTCPETVARGMSFGACGRPIKRSGKCGIHAAADEKRAANDKRMREKSDADRDAHALAEEQVALLVALGLDVQTRMLSHAHGYRTVIALTDPAATIAHLSAKVADR